MSWTTGRDLVRIAAFVVIFASPAMAFESSKTAPPVDKYRITEEELAACSSDAITYCSGTYPDEDKLLACMKVNHENLSSGCRLVFDQGVHRRRL